MKHLTILVPDGQNNNLSSIVGAYKIFSRANQYYRDRTGKELFTIELAGTSKEVAYYDGLFSVRPKTHISAITKSHLVIIPSLNHDYRQAVEENQLLVEWLKNQYKAGAEIASICTG